ncbi:MAG TPA: hypothetical protein VI336_02385 [Candidatus Saccharimonadales bacterium]|nr:hypothetical protein [Candidatus Saccharimonadales bacterium]
MERLFKLVKNKRYLFYLLVALAVVGLAVWLIFLRDNAADRTEKNSASYDTISDSSTGLSFNMSKKFAPISREELSVLNPGFSYGFRASDDPKAQCIISQVKLSAGGTSSPEELRDGVLGEVKKIHPDATIANEATALNLAKFGDAQGILLEIVYTEGNTKIKRVEVIALGKVNEVIAYCQSLADDNQRYYNDFTIFFSSLKLLDQQ